MRVQHLYYLSLIFFLFASTTNTVVAQEKRRIELIQADRLKSGKHNGKDINRVIGNVIFKHEGSTMYCDSAYQYVGKNSIDAFGHVFIDQEENKLYGDTLFYDGDKSFAEVFGKVKLIDDKMTLTTNKLDYDMKNKIGYYTTGGVIVDDESTLTSVYGHYYSKQNLYKFKKKVTLTRENYIMKSDTLHYNTATKVAYFFGPTTIKSAEKDLYAEGGHYETVTEKAYFKKNAWVETPKYKINGQYLFYDSKTDDGHAKDLVRIVSKKDSTVITGDEAFRYGATSISRVFGNTLLQKFFPNDTLFLIGDTLIAREDSINNKSYTKAFYNAEFIKGEMQGKCDSLYFDQTDSIFYMFRSPILWSTKHQITGDTIRAKLLNSELHKMYSQANGFIISHDTISQYNQIKGRRLIAHFKENEMDKVDVIGNGQSIFFAHDDDDKSTIGMNKVDCSNMIIRFKENELNDITFLSKPDAHFIPPHKLVFEDTRFKNFKWHDKIRPTREKMFLSRRL